MSCMIRGSLRAVDALQARVLNSTDSIDVPSPCAALFNNSFKVEGSLHYFDPKSEEKECKILPPQSKDPIIVLFRQQDFSQTCSARTACFEANLCVGVVLIMDMTPGALGWAAHSAWFSYDIADDGTLKKTPPMVYVRGGSDAATWLMSRATRNDIEVKVSMESGDPNEAEIVFKSWQWITLCTLSLLHSLWNTGLCLLKLISMPFYPQPPNLTLTFLTLLLPKLLSGFLRCCLFLNCAYFEMGLFSGEMVRLLFTLPVTLGIVSTTAIGVRVYHVHQEATCPNYRQQRSHRFFQLCVALLGVMLSVDIVHLIYVIFAFELFDPSLLAAFFTIIQVPVSVFFIRFASSTAKFLTATMSRLTVLERRKRQRFANRVRLSGWQ